MNPTAAELLPEAHVGVEAKVVAVSAVLVGVVIPVANQTLQQGQAQKPASTVRPKRRTRRTRTGLGQIVHCKYKYKWTNTYHS